MRRIAFFVEGDDDERFINTVIRPKLHQLNVKCPNPIKYSNESPQGISRILDVFNKNDWNYLFLVDADYYSSNAHLSTKLSSHIKMRRRQVKDNYSLKSEDIVVVVVDEIESWYLAGISKTALKKLGVSKKSLSEIGSYLNHTERVTKEIFNKLIPEEYGDSRSAFMVNLLAHYNLQRAMSRNSSLEYFIRKIEMILDTTIFKTGRTVK